MPNRYNPGSNIQHNFWHLFLDPLHDSHSFVFSFWVKELFKCFRHVHNVMWKQFYLTALGVYCYIILLFLLHNILLFVSKHIQSFSLTAGSSIDRRTRRWWDALNLEGSRFTFLVMSSTTVSKAHPAPWTRTWRCSFHQPECIIITKLHDIFSVRPIPTWAALFVLKAFDVNNLHSQDWRNWVARNRGGSALSSLVFRHLFVLVPHLRTTQSVFG